MPRCRPAEGGTAQHQVGRSQQGCCADEVVGCCCAVAHFLLLPRPPRVDRVGCHPAVRQQRSCGARAAQAACWPFSRTTAPSGIALCCFSTCNRWRRRAEQGMELSVVYDCTKQCTDQWAASALHRYAEENQGDIRMKRRHSSLTCTASSTLASRAAGSSSSSSSSAYRASMEAGGAQGGKLREAGTRCKCAALQQ